MRSVGKFSVILGVIGWLPSYRKMAAVWHVSRLSELTVPYSARQHVIIDLLRNICLNRIACNDVIVPIAR